MTSLGEADIYYQNQGVGKVRVRRIHPYSSFGPAIALNLSFFLPHLAEGVSQVKPPLRNYELRDLAGELRASESADTLAPIRWAGERRSIRSSDYPGESEITVVCDLDRGVLERYESFRAGKTPRFWLYLWPSWAGITDPGWMTISKLEFGVSRDDWVELLARVGLSHYELIEVRLWGPKAEEFKHAASHCRAARKLIDEGQYDRSAADCRLAIEALAKAIGLQQDPTMEQWQGR